MAAAAVDTSAAATSKAKVGEHKHDLAADVGKRLPVTVITGFLGSGKTTLLSYILNNKTHGYKIAVINNEFASALDIGTKHELDSKATDNATVAADIYETGSGCLCCGGGRSDLVRIMHELIHHKDKINYVLLETTGMADPSFSSIFMLEPNIRQHFYLDGFVTMIDAKHCLEQLNRTDTTTSSKKKKELTEEAVDVTKSTVANKSSGIYPPQEEEIINETVNQIAIADRVIINKIDLVPDLTELQSLEDRIKTINPLATCVRSEYARIGDLKQILAIKSFSMEKTLKVDSGFMDFRPFRRHDPLVQPLCFIAPPPNYNPKAAAKSVAVTEKGEAVIGVDMIKFEKWLRNYLTTNRANVLRCKAVLAVTGQPEKVMVQGVKDLVDIQSRQMWEADEPRVSRLVLIGRNLKESEIIESFNAAMHNPAKPETEQLKLRVYGGGGDGDAFAVRAFVFLIFVLIILYRWIN